MWVSGRRNSTQILLLRFGHCLVLGTRPVAGEGYVPSPGDIIFFDYDHNGSANHVGIVESCDGSTVYTIEGNASDAVKQLSYAVDYSGMGYGVPAYP